MTPSSRRLASEARRCQTLEASAAAIAPIAAISSSVEISRELPEAFAGQRVDVAARARRRATLPVPSALARRSAAAIAPRAAAGSVPGRSVIPSAVGVGLAHARVKSALFMKITPGGHARFVVVAATR